MHDVTTLVCTGFISFWTETLLPDLPKEGVIVSVALVSQGINDMCPALSVLFVCYAFQLLRYRKRAFDDPYRLT